MIVSSNVNDKWDPFPKDYDNRTHLDIVQHLQIPHWPMTQVKRRNSMTPQMLSRHRICSEDGRMSYEQN